MQDDDALRREVESLLAQEPQGRRIHERHQRRRSPHRPCLHHAKGTLVGQRLGGYAIRSLLGVGGMGEVYRAHDETLGREVAIKVLPAAFTADPERRARFEREARMLATLNHPHIGAIYGVEEADGVRGLVLELVEGETLAERIAAAARAASDSLHTAGPVHRPADHRGARDRAADRRGARRRPREGHRSPRSEAGEHQDHARTAR